MGNRKKTTAERLKQTVRNGSYGQKVKARTELNKRETDEALAHFDAGLSTLDKLKEHNNGR